MRSPPHRSMLISVYSTWPSVDHGKSGMDKTVWYSVLGQVSIILDRISTLDTFVVS